MNLNYEIFENDENVLAIAQNGDDKIIFVTCEPSALIDHPNVEAVATFDPNTVVVGINKDFFSPGQPLGDRKEMLEAVLAAGTMKAEEIFAARS
jgi:hypothetical protein